MNSQEEIDRVLEFKTWAILGLSNNPDRAAYSVAALLKQKGHTIIPVHPKAETVHGEKGYATLEEIPVKVDVVDFFINSELVSRNIDRAISIGAQAVWLQLGVIDSESVQRAELAGLIAIMDRCPAIEYGKK
ncbi:MAG: CoA-binding protein [Actinobacteria bacterium]|nr:CoA-binding protein [Actinomycetota bacterium]NDA95294.1 CoA-binding protein [Actinomycetota bacterium]NDH80524.1 CoA-binding protein [Actinomycetota bacterium]NDH98937.1 CoA-binding protein [Actinomycetota bacterium]